MSGIVQRSLTALGLIAGMNGPALAAPASDLQTIIVPVTAADLASEHATARLIERLKSAAREVCKEESRSDDGYLFARACQSVAMEDALAQVDRLRMGHVAALSTASIVIAAR
jgi:UrcA family protein